VVTRGHGVCAACLTKLEESLVTMLPPGPFATCRHRTFDGDFPQVKGDIQLVTEVLAERRILIGLFAPGAVVDVDCLQLEFEIRVVEQVEQSHRVGPPGEGDQNLAADETRKLGRKVLRKRVKGHGSS